MTQINSVNDSVENRAAFLAERIMIMCVNRKDENGKSFPYHLPHDVAHLIAKNFILEAIKP